jgi:hypothetical protein
MAGKAHDSEPQVFWCNTNRGAEPGGNGLEERMFARGFAAAWTGFDHPNGTFNYPDHMWRVRRGDMIFMYANGVGVIRVGRATESEPDILPRHRHGRLRDFASEGKNKEEWRIPVKWITRRQVDNPCVVEPLRSSFQRITHLAERVRKVRKHFRL